MVGGHRIGFGALVAAAVAVAAATPGSSPAGSAVGAAQPDVTVLIRQATKLVRKRPRYRRAVLLEADGRPAKRTTITAAGITRWRFVFNNQGTPRYGRRYRSVILFYRAGTFGRIVSNRSPFVEDLNIPKPPRMTLRTAVSKLRAAGHRRPFQNVTLRWPLAGRPGPEPLYIFGFASRRDPYISVGTRTGRVRPFA